MNRHKIHTLFSLVLDHREDVVLFHVDDRPSILNCLNGHFMETAPKGRRAFSSIWCLMSLISPPVLKSIMVSVPYLSTTSVFLSSFSTSCEIFRTSDVHIEFGLELLSDPHWMDRGMVGV